MNQTENNTPQTVLQWLREPVSSWHDFAVQALVDITQGRASLRRALHEAVNQRTTQALLQREMDVLKELADLLRFLVKQCKEHPDDTELQRLAAFWQGLRTIVLRSKDVVTPERGMDLLTQSDDARAVFRWLLEQPQHEVPRKFLVDTFHGSLWGWSEEKVRSVLHQLKQHNLVVPGIHDGEEDYLEMGANAFLMQHRYEQVFADTVSSSPYEPVESVYVVSEETYLDTFLT
ncbi:MAG: hypothetical protein EP343_29060 [Deltaproteobacteria bacterium]|nr:MAG: hypothetical protein EP343_29060 [Deltaproteobacteria bacterium]